MEQKSVSSQYSHLGHSETGKRSAVVLSVFLLLGFMFAFPKLTLEASREGLLLWFRTLLPTLLPFMILSNFLIRFNCIEKILNPFRKIWAAILGLSPYGAYAYLLGLLCGYPMGAKLTADLYSQKFISKKEAEYLLTFANNASPMFICTFVVLECIGHEELLLPSFTILYLSDYLCSLFFRAYYRTESNNERFCVSFDRQDKNKKMETSPTYPLGTLIDASIMNGFETITKLCGYILLFSILAKAINQFWYLAPMGKYLLLGTVEISTGLAQIAASTLSFPWKFSLLLSFTSFGGICILFQTKGVLNQSHLSLRPYLAGKALNFVLTFGLSWSYLLLTQLVH